jgi:hypothetical protein
VNVLLRRVVALVCFAATSAYAGDFIDTRIAFAFAEDDFFAAPGTTTVNSPGPGFGATRNNTQFFDNFNTRFTGFETLSNLTLYKKSPSFFEYFTAEAALSTLLLVQPSGQIVLFDNSSYVKLNYRPPGWGAKEEVALTGFPVSSDRFRLGYAWRISWGGDSAFTFAQGAGLSNSGRPSAAPGLKLQVTRDRWYAFVGMKTGLLMNNLINVQERVYGGLAGGGVDIVPNRLRFEANGGLFQRGLIPFLAQQNIRAPINAGGASAQLSLLSGSEILPSIDLRLYKNDPDILNRFFRPESYPGGLSYSITVEGSGLVQTLANPDRFATTQLQAAGAVAVQARFKYDFWRFWGVGLMRTPSFIQFDVPGTIPYNDYPVGSVVRPELWLALGADHFFARQHLTLGVVLGVQNPAHIVSPNTLFGGNTPPPGLEGPRTVIWRDVNQNNILPAGDPVQVIFSAKVNFKLDISEYFAILGEVQYNRDANRPTFRDSTQGVAQPVYELEHQLGAFAVMQARF